MSLLFANSNIIKSTFLYLGTLHNSILIIHNFLYRSWLRCFFLWSRRLTDHLVTLILFKSKLSSSRRRSWFFTRILSTWRSSSCWRRPRSIRWRLCNFLKLLANYTYKFVQFFILLCSFFNELSEFFKMFLMRLASTSALRRNLCLADVSSSNTWSSFYIIFGSVAGSPSSFYQLLQVFFHICKLIFGPISFIFTSRSLNLFAVSFFLQWLSKWKYTESPRFLGESSII